MTKITDKRFLPKNSSSNSRQKFIQRNKASIKKRIREIVRDSDIGDINKGDKRIKISPDDLFEPNFQYSPSEGIWDSVKIGNKKYRKGDRLPPPDGGSRGKGGGNGGGGDDDFVFVLTNREFLDIFFEDMALPDLVKKELLGIDFEIQHAGYSTSGGPSSLNIRKTMLNSLGRRTALTRKMKTNTDNKESSTQTDEELDKSANLPGAVDIVSTTKKIQYIEDIDLRYNFKEKVDMPSTRAVMFLLMDVSGSMGEREKDIAKRFYILLNLFLRKNYDIVDLVFVRHAEQAWEVDENEFFHGTLTGGTVISSGYEMIDSIIKSRYNPEQWNIYVAQTSDGGNFDDDMIPAKTLLTTKLLPVCQYIAYIDIISRMASMSNMYRAVRGMETGDESSDTFRLMKELERTHPNLQAREIDSASQIISVFKSLFKRVGTK